MRNPRAHSNRRDDGGLVEGDLRLPFLFQVLGWTARDAVGFAVGTFAAVVILINVLFMQSGSHPAPIFKAPDAAVKDAKPAAVTPIRRVDSIPAPAPLRLAAPSPRTP